MAVEGNKMHSQARFACMEGFNLVGPEEITCTASGDWSENPPHCEGIYVQLAKKGNTHYILITKLSHTRLEIDIRQEKMSTFDFC